MSNYDQQTAEAEIFAVHAWEAFPWVLAPEDNLRYGEACMHASTATAIAVAVGYVHSSKEWTAWDNCLRAGIAPELPQDTRWGGPGASMTPVLARSRLRPAGSGGMIDEIAHFQRVEHRRSAREGVVFGRAENPWLGAIEHRGAGRAAEAQHRLSSIFTVDI